MKLSDMEILAKAVAPLIQKHADQSETQIGDAQNQIKLLFDLVEDLQDRLIRLEQI